MDRNSILKEAIRIEIELSQLKEPNSPSKTHYSGCSLYSEKETSSIGNKSIKERVVEAQEKANSQHNREIGKSKIDRTKENSI
jgi:hypothetical protein